MPRAHHTPAQAFWITRQCERCGFAVNDRELATVRRHMGSRVRLHLGCLTPLERRVLQVRAVGTLCIFCGSQAGSMRLPQLIDHFSDLHGRVIVNW